jgi:DNA-binding transcriptional regulator GbsR (MarR family)
LAFNLDKTYRTNYLRCMNTNTDPVQDFVEAMGLRFQDQQMPRIAGRLFGLLLVEGGPFSFGELADRLECSRGSISTNARMLADFGLIERVAKPGDRQDHYRIAPEGLAPIFRKQMVRMREMSLRYRLAAEHLPSVRSDARRRLVAAAVLSEKAVEGLERGLAEAEAILAAQEMA